MISYDELVKMSAEKLIKLAHYYDLDVPKKVSKAQVLSVVKEHLEYLASFPQYGGASTPVKYSVRVQRAMDSQKGQN
jgi:hypothetical protein